MIPYSLAKQVLRRLYALPESYSWEDVRRIYHELIPDADWHMRNRFTSQFQAHLLKNAPVGYRDILYFDRYHRFKPNRQAPVVMTWVGKVLGEVVSLSFFQSRGFAPCKRVSITFRYHGMIFRGICSYESATCFRVKRIR